MRVILSASIVALLSSFAALSLAQQAGETLPPADATEPAPPPPPGATAPAAEPAAAAAPQPGPAPGPAPVMEHTESGGAHTHDGFFFRIGLNGGPLMMSADTATETKFSGFHSGFDLMFGGSPIKGLAIGGALIAGRTSDPTIEAGSLKGTANGTLLFAGVGLFGDFYLNPKEGLHFLGMVGFGTVDFVNNNGNSGGNDPSGTMLAIGAGYDFWVANEWSIGPFGRILYSSMSQDAGGASVKYSYLYPSIGIAFTLH
ncbi:MAG: autotransporter domain-containing protein [Myxococcales bacterium]|nr:autotransporter domain-containing protein [Myxococcales bacterium]